MLYGGPRRPRGKGSFFGGGLFSIFIHSMGKLDNINLPFGKRIVGKADAAAQWRTAHGPDELLLATRPCSQITLGMTCCCCCSSIVKMSRSATFARQKSTLDSDVQQQQQRKHPQKNEMQMKTATETETGPQQLETSAEKKKKTSAACSSRSKPRSPNKIYRTPPTPEPEILHIKERSFILDSIAVNTTSNDYSKARPKLGQV